MLVVFMIRISRIVLHSKYKARPRFENDDTVMDTFTTYADAKDKISAFQRRLKDIIEYRVMDYYYRKYNEQKGQRDSGI